MSGEVSLLSSSSKCEVFDLCDSDDKDTLLPLPLDQSCASLKSNDACLFAARGAAFVERRKFAAHQANRSLPDDPWRQQEERVVQDQEFFRRRMLAPRHVVEAASGKQHEVKQEEEFNDDGFVVGLSFIDHEGARHCAISWMFVGYA